MYCMYAILALTFFFYRKSKTGARAKAKTSTSDTQPVGVNNRSNDFSYDLQRPCRMAMQNIRTPSI